MTIFHFISSDDNTSLDSNVTLLFEVSSLDRFLRRTFKTYEAELDRAPQLGPSDLSSPLSLIEVARLAWSCRDGTRTAHTSLKLTVTGLRLCNFVLYIKMGFQVLVVDMILSVSIHVIYCL